MYTDYTEHTKNSVYTFIFSITYKSLKVTGHTTSKPTNTWHQKPYYSVLVIQTRRDPNKQVHQPHRELWHKAWHRLFCYVGCTTPARFNDAENFQAHDSAPTEPVVCAFELILHLHYLQWRFLTPVSELYLSICTHVAHANIMRVRCGFYITLELLSNKSLFCSKNFCISAFRSKVLKIQTYLRAK